MATSDKKPSIEDIQRELERNPRMVGQVYAMLRYRGAKLSIATTPLARAGVSVLEAFDRVQKRADIQAARGMEAALFDHKFNWEKRICHLIDALASAVAEMAVEYRAEDLLSDQVFVEKIKLFKQTAGTVETTE